MSWFLIVVVAYGTVSQVVVDYRFASEAECMAYGAKRLLVGYECLSSIPPTPEPKAENGGDKCK
jgi:hypothetical protein